MGFPQPRAWPQQPPQRAEVSAFGLTPIAVFNGALKKVDAVNGVYTEGSASSYGASIAGFCSQQTAVNTGLHRAVTVPAVTTGYVVVWHGVPVGAPSGSTPKYAGIATSTSSQSVDILGIEVGGGGADTIQVMFRTSSGTTGNLQCSAGMSAFYGKKVTLVAGYDVRADRIRLTVCADGFMQRFSAAAVVAGAAPAIVGTEQFCVGPDVVEKPTRHINARVALAGAFYGLTNSHIEETIARNPWVIFEPLPPVWLDSVSGVGGGATTTVSATLASITGSIASRANPMMAISATLANVTGSVTSGSGSLTTTITATLANIVCSITSTGSTTNGTFTSEVLKDYAGNVLANVSLNFVRFYNDTTGALVLNKTGVSTNGSGIVTFSDAALVAGTTYRVDWETAAGSRRMPRKAAA